MADSVRREIALREPIVPRDVDVKELASFWTPPPTINWYPQVVVREPWYVRVADWLCEQWTALWH